MSYIQQYYRELDNLRRVAGANNESALRQAFQFLLKTVSAEHKLVLYPEYPFKNKQGNNLRADGALIDDLRMVHGYWEAKDEKDDLDKEIQIKLNKGYPSDNIIFEDTKTAVLLQNGEEILRCSVFDETALQKLLNKFFNYETPEIQNFKLAQTKFLEELPKVGAALTDLLIEERQKNQRFIQQAQDFLKLCKRSIGERVTAQHVDEMLIQHILTDQIFRAIFPNSRFHEENHLAIAIHQLENSFFHGKTRQNLLKRLIPYFSAIQEKANAAVSSHEKQRFLKQIYEQFYSAYNPKDADKLGVVYTPNEAVQFMISACDHLSQKHFNKKLQENGLDILDPCTGTGTFIVGLLDYWRGNYTHNELLKYKFEQEIHANEISILPYYIACLNIEQSFYELTNEYSEFKGACFVNTLDNWGFEQKHSGANYDMFGGLTDENHARIQSQNQKLIPIIIGNPPYNANQKNENDNNKNDKAELVDKRIKETYLAESNAQKTKLYDPYVRFIRWASDRVGDQGIIAFISNSSFIDAKGFDGFRKVIAHEFQEVFIIDLKGNARTSGERRKLEGGNVFDDKIRVGIALYFFVRNPQISKQSIHYLGLDDYLTAVEKRQWLHSNNLHQLIKERQFIEIRPNKHGVWLNQAEESDEWNNSLPLASKEAKAGKAGSDAIFTLHSLGVVTNRDEWVYDFDKENLQSKVQFLIETYNDQTDGELNHEIKWTRAVKNDLKKNIQYHLNKKLIIDSLYRPFVCKKLYFSQNLNEMQYKQRHIFNMKSGKFDNVAISINGITSNKSFESIAVNKIHDLHFYGDSVTLPLWVYDKNGEKQENISNWALSQFRNHYDDSIIKEAIFHYVYAVLHDPHYRKKYALHLKTEFPRIPFRADFHAWADIGKQLMDLHLNYESGAKFSLQRENVNHLENPKVKLKADKENGRIVVDENTILKGIPQSAWNYQLGNRSALEWVLDQYKEKMPKDKTIAEKFNNYRFADYKEQVIDLLSKVCHVSVETVRLVQQLEK